MQMANRGREDGTGDRDEVSTAGVAATPSSFTVFFTLHVHDLRLQVSPVWQPRPQLRLIVKQTKAGKINSLRLFKRSIISFSAP